MSSGQNEKMENGSLLHYEKRLNEVIDAVEQSYDQALPLERLAEMASFSPYHFHRIFKSYTGETPSVFVKRLRLQKAIGLIESRAKKSLAEIALNCGFAQSSDFSRAFRETYGYPPSQHKKGRLAEDSKIRQDMRPSRGYGFYGQNTAVQEDQFEVRVQDLPEQRIAYIRVIGGFNPGKLMASLSRLLDWGRKQGIYPGATLAATSPDNPDIVPISRYRMDLCMILPVGAKETGRMSFTTMPSRRYAMVHSFGDIHKVERAWTHLFSNWLPRSGYEPDNAPYVEIFRNSDDSNGWATLDLDCCVPIRTLAR